MGNIDAITLENAKKDLRESVSLWTAKANEVFGASKSIPTIDFGIRGVVAGRAFFSRWAIALNIELYLRHPEDFKNRTVPHEIAHLYNNFLNRTWGFRLKPHGKEWKRTMVKMGVKDTSRCHNYDTMGIKRVRERPFVYKCNCRTFNLTRLIHNKIMMGQSRYCPKCKHNVSYVGIAGKVETVETT